MREHATDDRAQRSPEGRPRGLFLAAMSSHDPSAKDDDARVAPAPEPKIVDASTANLGAKIKETTARVVRPRPTRRAERATYPTNPHVRIKPRAQSGACGGGTPGDAARFHFFYFYFSPARPRTDTLLATLLLQCTVVDCESTYSSGHECRARACAAHCAAESVFLETRDPAVAFRYCYQCHKFHELDAFVGGEGEVRNRHNCYASQQKRLLRRKQNDGARKKRDREERETARRAAVAGTLGGGAQGRLVASRNPDAAPPAGLAPDGSIGNANGNRYIRALGASDAAAAPEAKRPKAGTMAALLARGGEGVPLAYGSVLDRKFGAASFVPFAFSGDYEFAKGPARAAATPPAAFVNAVNAVNPLNSKPWERLVDPNHAAIQTPTTGATAAFDATTRAATAAFEASVAFEPAAANAANADAPAVFPVPAVTILPPGIGGFGAPVVGAVPAPERLESEELVDDIVGGARDTLEAYLASL